MDERIWHRHYDVGVPPTIDYERISIPGFLQRTAGRIPDSPALVFQNLRMTYGELADCAARCASALAGLGVGPGVRVAIQLPNIPQNVIAYFGALSLGAEVVMTNPIYTPREIEHQWRDAACEVAITTDYIYDQKIRKERAELPPKHYLLASIPEYLRFPLNLLAPLKLRRADPPLVARVREEPGVHRFRALIERSSPDPPRPEIDFEAVAVLQYTGGTTGVSKAAMLTHRNLSANVQQVQSWFTGVEFGREVLMTCLPLFHVFGMTVAMNWGISTGAKLVLIPDPRDVKTLVKSIVKQRVTLFPGVPAMFNAINHFPGIDGLDVGSVKSCFSGSAPIARDVLERFERLTGSRIIEGFGMSESSPVTHVNPLGGLRKVGSVGIPVPDTDARIVDAETGKVPVPTGEEGELVVSGPQVMKGYWGRPDETALTLRDGWLYTGDLAVMDEQGYFQIVGRKKDMINAGGFKVFPDEVDEVLMSHDGILEAATIGVPHVKRGETVKSFVVRKPGSSVSVEEIDAYCRERLAAYKVPRYVEFIDALPKSSVLKVLRRELRDREIAKLEES